MSLTMAAITMLKKNIINKLLVGSCLGILSFNCFATEGGGVGQVQSPAPVYMPFFMQEIFTTTVFVAIMAIKSPFLVLVLILMS